MADETIYKFGEGATDADIVATVQHWLKNSKPYHDELLKFQERSLKYYKGNQTDRDEIPTHKSNTVYNRIFEATETLVPIVTSSAHQFLAVPGENSEVSIKNARALQLVLSRKYTDVEMPKKLEMATRDIILKRFGVLEWGWDNDIDDVNVWVLDPRLVLVPRLRCDINSPSFPYVLVIEEYDRSELVDNFDVDPEELTMGKSQLTVSIPEDRTSDDVYLVIKAVTNDYWVWIQGDKILKREKNQYWDYTGEETSYIKRSKNGRKRQKKLMRFYNHLDRPQKPYVFLTPFITGEAPVAETSLAEVAIPMQDDINTQKRQIVNNLVKMGNGQVYIDSDALPQELIDQITDEAGLILVGKGLASENRIRREAGTPLPNAHFANLQASISAFDNVFGLHSSTRGAGQSKTLGQDVLNRQQDFSRVDQITRELNRAMNRVADGLTQLMKMFYDDVHVIPIVGKDDALEFLHFTRENIEDQVAIETKSGTPVLLDPVARSNRAIQMWQLNAIDPESFFEEMSFGDPKHMAQKLAAWKQGMLVFESQLKAQEAISVADATAGAKTTAEGTPKAPGGERKAETPQDSQARSLRDTMNRGRAPLPGNINVNA